jgi:hypothetical protein
METDHAPVGETDDKSGTQQRLRVGTGGEPSVYIVAAPFSCANHRWGIFILAWALAFRPGGIGAGFSLSASVDDVGLDSHPTPSKATKKRAKTRRISRPGRMKHSSIQADSRRSTSGLRVHDKLRGWCRVSGAGKRKGRNARHTRPVPGRFPVKVSLCARRNSPFTPHEPSGLETGLRGALIRVARLLLRGGPP